MTLRTHSPFHYIGESGDTKPSVGATRVADNYTYLARDLPVNSTFEETDTGDIYKWDGDAWRLWISRLERAMTTLTTTMSAVLTEMQTQTGLLRELTSPIEEER